MDKELSGIKSSTLASHLDLLGLAARTCAVAFLLQTNVKSSIVAAASQAYASYLPLTERKVTSGSSFLRRPSSSRHLLPRRHHTVQTLIHDGFIQRKRQREQLKARVARRLRRSDSRQSADTTRHPPPKFSVLLSAVKERHSGGAGACVNPHRLNQPGFADGSPFSSRSDKEAKSNIVQ